MLSKNIKVSIIIPCFNAELKIGTCLRSLNKIEMNQDEYEIIFIDDFSTDGTYRLLQKQCALHSNWKIYRLDNNSGSPSKPRNFGTLKASGEYLFYLDCDDEIFAEALTLSYNYAKKYDCDIVRGYLFTNDGKNKKIANKINNWNEELTKKEKITQLVQHQSMGSTMLVKKIFLMVNNISWQEDIRMGEDTLFLARALIDAKNIGYVDTPLIIYNKFQNFNTSSITQAFGAKELNDHLLMWPKLANYLLTIGINYYKLRFKVSLQYVISLLINRNKNDIDEHTFNKFSQFIIDKKDIIDYFNYTPRYKEIIETIYTKDFINFRKLCRPRMLIAGHDLKFITPIIPILSTNFDIKIDEWTGHSEHDESKSRSLLNWAEIIWCEWLLDNAVWYTNNKLPHQKIIIRMHRFELSRDFGEKINVDNVDAIVTVSVHFFERLLERFPNISREKLRLIPNFVSTKNYTQIPFSEKQLFTLGIIGILPARKGFYRALNILNILRLKDSRYRLEVFGKIPEDLLWVSKNPIEMNYFNKCNDFIKNNKLVDAVNFNGHIDLKENLSRKQVGFILSTSDSTYDFPGGESFHLAIADAFASGGIGLIKNWLGAEYIWPENFILNTEEDIVKRIISYQKKYENFMNDSILGRNFLLKNYNEEKFAKFVKEMFLEFF